MCPDDEAELTLDSFLVDFVSVDLAELIASCTVSRNELCLATSLPIFLLFALRARTSPIKAPRSSSFSRSISSVKVLEDPAGWRCCCRWNNELREGPTCCIFLLFSSYPERFLVVSRLNKQKG